MSTHDPARPIHVAHLTSVHSRYDTRIFRKQCRSLVRAGFRVSLVVADGKGDEITGDGIEIYDVGKPSRRMDRILWTSVLVGRRGLALDADLYQFHDPELLPVGVALKCSGKRAIFDSHEDVPKQMFGKPYLNPFVLRILASLVGCLESWAARWLDAVIAATPSIAHKFLKVANRVENVNNFPELGELENDISWREKANEICYVGGIAKIRGVLPLIEALGETKFPARLNLVGTFAKDGSEEIVKSIRGWSHVNELGFLGRSDVRDVLARSVAGIVTFLPMPNHIDAQPNKMFEYMAAGIPVIASDFPLWREIIVGRDCGLCVNPLDPAEIAAAIDTIVSNPRRAAEMGRNGQEAVRTVFNWAAEERKLVQLYRELLV